MGVAAEDSGEELQGVLCRIQGLVLCLVALSAGMLSCDGSSCSVSSVGKLLDRCPWLRSDAEICRLLCFSGGYSDHLGSSASIIGFKAFSETILLVDPQCLSHCGPDFEGLNHAHSKLLTFIFTYNIFLVII